MSTRAERLGLEPASVLDNDPRGLPLPGEVQHSIAISLKRIADAICGDERNTGIHRAILEIASGNQL